MVAEEASSDVRREVELQQESWERSRRELNARINLLAEVYRWHALLSLTHSHFLGSSPSLSLPPSLPLFLSRMLLSSARFLTSRQLNCWCHHDPRHDGMTLAVQEKQELGEEIEGLRESKRRMCDDYETKLASIR